MLRFNKLFLLSILLVSIAKSQLPTVRNGNSGNGGGIADPGANGIIIRTGLNTTDWGTMSGTANRIVVSNPDGTIGHNIQVSTIPEGIAQKFFGTTAPGSIAGNYPGDFYTDTTNHNQYVCNAPAGTPPPACTSVTAAGWMTSSGGIGLSGLTTNLVTKATSSTAIGNSSISDDGTTVSTAENLTIGAGSTAGGQVVYGNATGDTAASSLDINSGDGASNTEPGYLKLWSSHATKRKAALFSCTNADGFLCIANTTPTADASNIILTTDNTATLTNKSISIGQITGGVTQTIASGTSVLGTSAIAANACATVVTTTATGTASTDTITWSPNADISGVTGYGITSTDGLKIYPYPTTNNVNWRVCNGTAASITPGAVTLNWRVVR